MNSSLNMGTHNFLDTLKIRQLWLNVMIIVIQPFDVGKLGVVVLAKHNPNTPTDHNFDEFFFSALKALMHLKPRNFLLEQVPSENRLRGQKWVRK